MKITTIGLDLAAIRDHLAEFGIVIRQGVKALPQALPKLLEETDTTLPP